MTKNNARHSVVRFHARAVIALHEDRISQFKARVITNVSECFNVFMYKSMIFSLNELFNSSLPFCGYFMFYDLYFKTFNRLSRTCYFKAIFK